MDPNAKSIFGNYNPIKDTSLPIEERMKYVREGATINGVPVLDIAEKRKQEKREEVARNANLVQYAQNGMSLEEQEAKLMREYAPYMAPSANTKLWSVDGETPIYTPDPQDAPPVRPYTDEQLSQMAVSPSNAFLYAGSAGYNMYGYNPYCSFYQQPYGYNGYSYGYAGSYAMDPMYRQFMSQQEQDRQALYMERINIMSIIIAGAYKGAGRENPPTVEEVKKEMLEPPQKKVIDYYANREEKVTEPTIILKRGGKVISVKEGRTYTLRGKEVMESDKKIYDFKAMVANGCEASVARGAKFAWINQQRQLMRQKYPIDMSIDEFWSHYGTEMYHDYIDGLISSQQRKLLTLYGTDEFTKVLKGFTKRVNPYAYQIMQNAFMNTNNGRVDLNNFGPVNVNDLEVSLPYHLMTNAQKRKAEFLAHITGGKIQVPGQNSP